MSNSLSASIRPPLFDVAGTVPFVDASFLATDSYLILLQLIACVFMRTTQADFDSPALVLDVSPAMLADMSDQILYASCSR